MAIIDPNEIGLFFTIRKKLNKPVDVNPLKPNSRANAFPLLLPGVYKLWRRYGKVTNWRCNFWEQPYPGSPKQVAWQSIYREAIAAWNALTTDQKSVYAKKAYGKHLNGYNLFVKEFLTTKQKLLQENGGIILQEDRSYLYGR